MPAREAPPVLAHWPARPAENLLDDSIGAMLARRAVRDGDRTAVRWPDGDGVASLTYAELAAAAKSVAHLLSDLPAGERVAVWGRNCVEWVLLEYGCALRGLPLVPLNTAWTDHEASAAVELVRPAVIFAGHDGRGEPLGPRAAALLGPSKTRDLRTLRDLPAAPDTPDTPDAAVDVTPDSPLLIQFTSGTTGRAKGAVLSHRAALNSAYLRSRRDRGNANGGGVCLNAVPFHHIGGSVFVVLGALSTGGSFVVLDRFRPEETVRLLLLAGATEVGGVPLMIENVLDRLADSTAAAPGLSTVALGGASISPVLVRRIREQTGASVMITYGQSECPLVTNSEHTDPAELIASTVGRPCEATEVRIVEPDTGATVGYGETGEIQVRSPMVMTGYFGMPEQTAEVIGSDGFLRTGDLGSMDENGYVTIRDRVRDVIIRGGENIYPAEVEAALAEHPSVAASAVVGIADPRWGEQIGATVVSRGDPLDPAELERFLSGRLAHFKIPRTWRMLDALPLTASGKIRRNVVRAQMNVQPNAEANPATNAAGRGTPASIKPKG